MATSKYDILGVPRNASNEEIRAAYLRLARTSHPDLNHGYQGAESRFKAIQRAYETLRDPASRQRYDLGIVDKAVVYSEGHRRADHWPQQDTYDADFDITANQLSFGSRSNQSAVVAMGLVMLVGVGFSMLWMGPSTNPSAAVGQHKASLSAKAPARVPNEPAEKTGALAKNNEVHLADEGIASKHDKLPTESFLERTNKTADAIPVPVAHAENEQPLANSLLLGSSMMVLSANQEFPNLVLDELPFDLRELTRQSTAPDPVISIGCENFVSAYDLLQIPSLATQIFGEPDSVHFDSTIAAAQSSPPLINDAAVLKTDWQSSPMYSPEFFGLASVARLDGSPVLTPSDSTNMDGNVISSAKDGFSSAAPLHHDQSARSVSFSSVDTDARSRLPAANKTLEWDPFARSPARNSVSYSNTPVYSSAPKSSNTLPPGLPLGSPLTHSIATSPINRHPMSDRRDGHVDPVVPSVLDSQLPSTEGMGPLSHTFGGQLSSSPIHFQNSPRNVWDTVTGGLQNPAPSYRTADQAKPRHRNPISNSSGHSTKYSAGYPSASSSPVYSPPTLRNGPPAVWGPSRDPITGMAP